MVVEKVGDVLKSDERVIVHGCNCKCAMGSGIARQIREQFPAAYQADQKTLWGDRNKLGTFTYAFEERPNGDKVAIVNAYTQYNYTRTEVDLDYDALEHVMVRICEYFPQKIIAMPRIGCGLAGGDWERVKGILEHVSERFHRTFNVYILRTLESLKDLCDHDYYEVHPSMGDASRPSGKRCSKCYHQVWY